MEASTETPQAPIQGPSPSRSAQKWTYAYPLLFAIFPVLALYAENIDQIDGRSVLRPLAVVLILGALIMLGFRLVLRHPARASIATSVVMALAGSYGYLYDALKTLTVFGLPVVRHRFMLPLTMILLGLAVLLLHKARSVQSPNLVAAVVGCVLVAQPIVRIGSYVLEAASINGKLASQRDSCANATATGMIRPDIYLIIMDAYERSDILREMNNYDNSPFLDQLEAIGFYVADASLSNYSMTELSLPSVLNMDYIQNFPDRYSEESDSRLGVIDLLDNSRVRRELECIGYSTVAFETGVVWTEWRDADYYLTMRRGALYQLQFVGRLSRFESLLARASILRALFDLGTSIGGSQQEGPIESYETHRERVLFELDQLGEVAALPSPKFVFLHVLSPHPPFIFGPNGESVQQAQFETDAPGENGEQRLLKAYADQVNFLNSKLVPALQRVLDKSQTPPVIILQGDHGWADRNHEDKLSIMNAYYLPDGGRYSPYPTITPVNSFRLVFSNIFGSDLPLLSDLSYYSTDEQPFMFEPVANSKAPNE